REDGLGGERAGLELGEAVERLAGDRALVLAFLRGEIAEDRLHVRVGEVRRDLRAHDAGPEDGRLSNQESLRFVAPAVAARRWAGAQFALGSLDRGVRHLRLLGVGTRGRRRSNRRRCSYRIRGIQTSV